MKTLMCLITLFMLNTSPAFTTSLSVADLEIICPMDTLLPSCLTQAQVDNQFNVWLSSASFSGGCDVSLSNNAGAAPNACGGSVTVSWTVTSSCDTTKTCSAIFGVQLSEPILLVCPLNTTADSCQTQTSIDTQFASWLATSSYSGGCNSSLSNDNSGAPNACGASKTVQFTVHSTCEPDVTCTASFSVTAAPPVVINCPANQTEKSGQDQTTIDSLFNLWLAMANMSGGCLPSISNNNSGAPPNSGGSTTVVWTITSSCEAPVTCDAVFTVQKPSATNESTSIELFSLLPNPVHKIGTVRIRLSEPKQLRLQLRDLMGKTVWSEDSVFENRDLRFDFGDFTPGLYFVQLTVGEEQSLLKWMIE